MLKKLFGSKKPKTNDSASSSTTLPHVLEQMSPLWTDNQQQRQKLFMRGAHRALDIPEDDMQITSSKSGIGAMGAIGIALAAGVPAAIVAFALRGRPTAAPVPAIETPTFRYRVKIGFENGKLYKRLLDENGKVVKELE